jgi:hypothetical protein
MKMKRLSVSFVFLSISAIVWAQPAADRQELAKLPEDARSTIATWLHQDCGVDELQGLQNRLQRLGLPLEPVFWEAYRLGPTEEERRIFREQSRQRYQERQSHLKTFGERLFGKEETAQLVNAPEEQYVQRRLDDYVNRYKTAALAGLGIVGTSPSALLPIAEDDKNPAQGAAKEALQSIERRMER